MKDAKKERSPDIVVMVYDPRNGGHSLKVRITAAQIVPDHYDALEKIGVGAALLITVPTQGPIDVVRA